MYLPLCVSGETEHKRLCRRVIAKFTGRLNWDSTAAKSLTGGQNTQTPPVAESGDAKAGRMLNFIFAAGDLGRPFDQIKVSALSLLFVAPTTCNNVSSPPPPTTTANINLNRL